MTRFLVFRDTAWHLSLCISIPRQPRRGSGGSAHNRSYRQLKTYTKKKKRGTSLPVERNELDKVVEEFGRRGYRLADRKVAKRMREALQLYEKNPEKGMPLEYPVVPETPTPITPGVVVTEMPDDDSEPKVGDQNPEVRRLREDVQKFMKDILGTISQLGLPGQSKSSTDK